jgi:hypothetical protein
MNTVNPVKVLFHKTSVAVPYVLVYRVMILLGGCGGVGVGCHS